ncbi:Ribonuclease H2 non-catalytic subunit (Ylr154p-like) family protein [Cryptosporidium meleagridis]|uniref:Ribonuclease H2 non-catalytic subunit (Ylr154p-like) family protein n=1 Tax=Cryptosporidium meleagridis TaxID=93969 RepID=A0A2P4Z462_9CRYT|nr:Ribonuclease H2 non-catalytic subunit (Ylr154p-like) family protein [Cryptosporidium meleagridis]
MSLNILPFQIIFDGKLPKENPFNKLYDSTQSQSIASNKVTNIVLSKSFRGRKLNGRIIHLSNSSHSLLILSKNNSRKKMDLIIDKPFNQVTYWNYDDKIRQSDDIPQFLNVIHKFNILHRET